MYNRSIEHKFQTMTDHSICKTVAGAAQSYYYI